MDTVPDSILDRADDIELVDITPDAQGKPNVHLHLVLSRQDGSTVSGHLISATVDPILEVFVTDLGPGRDVAVP